MPEDTREICAAPIEQDSAFGGASGSGCDSATALLCEDFEGEFSRGYSVVFDSSELEAQQCLAATGSRSVSQSGYGLEGFAHVQMPLAEQVDSGPLHVRFFAYVPSHQELPSLAGLFLLRATPQYEEDEVTLLLRGQGMRLSTAQGHDDSQDEIYPLDEWFCVEIALDVGANGGAEIFVNGTSVLSVANIPTRPDSGPISLAQVFGATFEGVARHELAVDDVVADRAPIGCELD